MSQYTIPSVVEKTVRGERAVDIYSRLLTDRIVYVGTEIDDGVANVVIAQLLHLESESPESPINLYLNSPGGSVTAMLAIYDTMQFVRSPIGTTCVGQAASSAHSRSEPRSGASSSQARRKRRGSVRIAVARGRRSCCARRRRTGCRPARRETSGRAPGSGQQGGISHSGE